MYNVTTEITSIQGVRLFLRECFRLGLDVPNMRLAPDFGNNYYPCDWSAAFINHLADRMAEVLQVCELCDMDIQQVIKQEASAGMRFVEFAPMLEYLVAIGLVKPALATTQRHLHNHGWNAVLAPIRRLYEVSEREGGYILK